MTIRTDLDGLRFRMPGHPEVFLVDHGLRRHIADPATYDNMFRDWNSIIQDPSINNIDIGPDIIPGSVLIQAVGQNEVYWVDRGTGTTRHIDNPATMDRYDFDWNKINHVQLSAIPAYPFGPDIV